MTVCICDYESPIFFSQRIVKSARKKHKCFECNGKILIGESYEETSGMWERYSGVDIYKTCERCYDIRVWLTNNLPCFCWCYGRMLEDGDEWTQDVRHSGIEGTEGIRFGFLRRRRRLDLFNIGRRFHDHDRQGIQGGDQGR